MKLPTDSLFSALRQSAKPKAVSAIEKLIHDAPDRELCRINALAFAARHGLDEDDVLAAFLHGARALPENNEGVRRLAPAQSRLSLPISTARAQDAIRESRIGLQERRL